MLKITSRDNDLIKSLVLLKKSGEERKIQKKILLDGARLCYDAVCGGILPETVLYTPEAASKYSDYLAPILQKAERCVEISVPVSEKLSDTPSPQGVFCVCPSGSVIRPCETLSCGRYIALECLQDPGNLGTVIRTAAALGADGVIMTEDCADWSSQKVLRSSMGSVFRVPLYLFPDALSAISALRNAGVPSYAALLSEDAVELQRWSGQQAAFWVGNEGNGLTDTAAYACDGRVMIPMSGGVESLNASVCASILLWELTRSKNL